MRRDDIRAHFERKGYKVITCFSGKYVIKKVKGFGQGFDKTFPSLSAAHKHYFGY